MSKPVHCLPELQRTSKHDFHVFPDLLRFSAFPMTKMSDFLHFGDQPIFVKCRFEKWKIEIFFSNHHRKNCPPLKLSEMMRNIEKSQKIKNEGGSGGITYYWTLGIYVDFQISPPPFGDLGVQNSIVFWFFDSNSPTNARRVLIPNTRYLYWCLNTFLPILKIFDTLVVSYDPLTLSKSTANDLFFS